MRTACAERATHVPRTCNDAIMPRTRSVWRPFVQSLGALGLSSIVAGVAGHAGCAARENARPMNLTRPSAAPISPAGHTSADADRWHEERIASLTADNGWLTLIDLAFLEDGVYSFGADPSCRLRYDHLSGPRVGAFVVEADRVTFAVDLDRSGHPAATVTADGREIDVVELVADDRGTPTVLRDGPVSVTLIRRDGRLALRVKDNLSPTRPDFAGIDRFPFDPRLVVDATVTSAPAGSTVAVTNVRGHTSDEPLAATVTGAVHGHAFSFAATAGNGGRLFVVFGDATNGAETYGGGRFLDLAPPSDGRTVVDFNRAFNPPCSFTPFATCPTPPLPNRLPVAVRAGEKRPTGPT